MIRIAPVAAHCTEGGPRYREQRNDAFKKATIVRKRHNAFGKPFGYEARETKA
jgi:hypothetical protein